MTNRRNAIVSGVINAESARRGRGAGHRRYLSIAWVLLPLLLGACNGSGSSDGETHEETPLLGISQATAGSDVLTAESPKLVSTVSADATHFDYTYTVRVSNTGTVMLRDVSASVTSQTATAVVMDTTLSFGDLAPGASTTSGDTFTLRVDRTAPRAATLTLTLSATADDAGPAEGVLLGGQPGDLALSRMLDMPPVAAEAPDIVDGIILTRLSASIRSDATVSQVNSALGEIGGGIVGMQTGSTEILIAVPRQSDIDSLQALADQFQAQPGILIAVVGRNGDPDLAPPAESAAVADAAFSHLRAARFPAAWNAHAAIQPCGEQRLTLVVADHFGDGSDPGYETFDTEVSGVVALNQGTAPPEGEGTHGYDVLAMAVADLDAFIPTGAAPFRECVDLRVINLFGLPDGTRAQLLSQILPTGKVVLNTSYGYEKCPNPCTMEQARPIPSAYERAYAGAIQRQLLQSLAGNVLVTSTAGNNGDKQVKAVYPGAALADYNSAMNVAARSDGTYSWITNTALWDNESCIGSCYPSLTATADERTRLTAWIEQNGQASAAASVNVLIVGASERNGDAAGLSSPTADIFAVGNQVPGASGELMDGSSFAAPQVAGLALYLWQLSPELRERPVADTIAAIRATVTTAAAPGIDAYATVLSIDGGQPLTPAAARIRFALLDVNEDDSFDEADLQLFRTAYVPGGVLVNPTVRDDSRHDLNGDGRTGGDRRRPFDLDLAGSPRFGQPQLNTVTVAIAAESVVYAEASVTDAEILCYYAHSALYTGSEAARETALAGLCTPITIEITPASITVSPGQTVQLNAIVHGTSDQSVTWTLPNDGGTVVNGLFTAGPDVGYVTVRATSGFDPAVSTSAIVLVGVPRSWAGTITISETSSMMHIVDTPPSDTSVNGEIFLGSTYRLSDESTLSVTVPVEIEFQGYLGTTEGFTLGTVSGTGSHSFAEETIADYISGGCHLVYHHGKWIDQFAATGASADNFANNFSLRLGSDGSYTLFFGTVLVEGQARQRELDITADAPTNPVDCYVELGNGDYTETAPAGVGGGGFLNEASGVITNGEMTGSAQTTIDWGESYQDGRTGSIDVNVTWSLQAR